MKNSLATQVAISMAPQRALAALPVDGQIAEHHGRVSYWCGCCTRWVDVHIDLDGARSVHERGSHG